VLNKGGGAALAILGAVALWIVQPAKDFRDETRRLAQEQRVLRVCADPNNLPFSNEREEGFENRIATLVAREMNARLEYFWWAQHRGFVRNTLGAGKCDALLGIVADSERVLTTQPYYRSAWMFVSRADRRLSIQSFDSPQLKRLRIGVHLIGDDGANTPPAHALERRHMAANIVGFHLTGDYLQPNPPAEMLRAVVRGDVDVAVAWGPLAGYFAKSQKTELNLTPVSPAVDTPNLPMTYDIAAGVRRGEVELRGEIDAILSRKSAEITRILDNYGVPRLDSAGQLIRRELR
jgi:mxaJ protein